MDFAFEPCQVHLVKNLTCWCQTVSPSSFFSGIRMVKIMSPFLAVEAQVTSDVKGSEFLRRLLMNSLMEAGAMVDAREKCMCDVCN